MKAHHIKLRRLPVVGCLPLTGDRPLWVLSYTEQHNHLISQPSKVLRTLFFDELDGAIAYLLLLELGGAI